MGTDQLKRIGRTVFGAPFVISAGMKLFHLDQLNIKDQCCKWRDLCSVTSLTVCKVVRDEKLPFVTLFHKLKSLNPSCDYLSNAECCSLTSLVRAVKYGTADKTALVVTLYAV